MLELVAPAGSPEGVIAAVQNGADAVYLGFKEFNSCIDAKNFTYDELGRSLEYCRIRGVKTYLAQDSIVYDYEMPFVAENTRQAARYGIDAVIVRDLGVMRVVRQVVPDLPVFGSTKMAVHNLEGVKMAAAMGLKRITLAHELTRKEIYHICRYSPIDIEVSVHGNLCIGYAGQCYMSTINCTNSDNRGVCDKPCQKKYKSAGHELSYPLSLKDNCLIRYLQDLESIGVASVCIEGRDKRPEYTALVTGMYSKTIRRKKAPSRDSMHTLKKTFSRSGFTNGYYTNRKDIEMLGRREADEREETPLYISTRKLYLNGEFQRVPIRFVGSVAADKPIKLAAADDKKNAAVAYGPIPEAAFHKEFTYAMLQTELYKTSGTPFVCLGVKGKIEPGLTVPMSAFSELRTQLFAEILEQRKPLIPREEREYTPGVYSADDFVPDLHEMNTSATPLINVAVAKIDQVSNDLADLSPNILYIPITEISYESKPLRRLIDSDDTTIAVILPRVIYDNEKKEVARLMEFARNLGIVNALVSNIGHVQFAKGYGMFVRGDYAFNVCNSETLYVLKKLGFISAAISFEMRLLDIRSMPKPIDTEIISYGRLPLMYTENCIIRNCTGTCTCDSFSGLEDENGMVHPVTADYGCRNVVLSSKKLFLADKPKSTATLGVNAQRLNFTTENAVECVTVMKRYMRKSNYSPQNYMRGVYFKEPAEVL